MGQRKRRRAADRTLRTTMQSPGRPTVARREDRQRFWKAIARWRSERGGSARLGACRRSLWPRSRGVTCRWPREEIALLKAQNCGVRNIARRIGRDPGTVSRELRRNAATRDGGMEYRATTAQWHAERRAKRPKTAKLAANQALREYVQQRLSGQVQTPDGRVVPGPEVPWTGRCHGSHKDRR